MVVTLKIVSYQKAVLGSNAQVQFGPGGGSFGRAEDNSWVLPDPERIISSRHGLVGFRDGEFWITDCSTNGIFIGNKNVLLGKGESVMLHHGDRFLMGEYEVEVALEAARQQSNEMSANVGASCSGPDNLINEPQFDPLKALGDGPGNLSGESPGLRAQPPAEREAGAMANHSSPMHDALDMPGHYGSGNDSGQAETSEPIPEDWDMTGFFAPAAENAASKHPEANVEDPFGHVACEQMSDESVQDNKEARAGSVAKVTPQPAATKQVDRQTPDHCETETPKQHRHNIHPHPDIEHSSVVGDVPAPAVPEGDEADLVRTFLGAAGLDSALFASTDASEVMNECGQLFGDLLQGMMELLRARSEMKNEFRMSLTTVRASENNPLKFTINASEVLRILLVDKPSGYLAADAAVAEGVDDLRNHQIAMIAGMQAAFTSLVQRLDPGRFSNGDEQKSWLRSLLPVADKAGAWDNYRHFYRDTASTDRAFQKLFGDVFAQAYEEQTQRLRFEARK